MNPKARKILAHSVKQATTSVLKKELKHHKHAAISAKLPHTRLQHKETCQLIYGELIHRKSGNR